MTALPRSVLVVDDSQVQRDHIAALCRSLGVQQIHLAAHGADALRLLARLPEPPEAMVVDLEMPVMDGVELIEQLRQRSLLIPFVVASTREAVLVQAVETMARLQGLPVIHGLNKPVTESALREALGRIAAPRRTADSVPVREAAAPIEPAALARAIAGGAIVPHYQPKVCARTGVIRGLEVLARWPDAALGHPVPDRFIAAAEADGQIGALTFSVARQAFAHAAHWNARGLMLSLAVNLSPRLLDRPTLVDQLSKLAARHGLAPQQIVFEVTEGSTGTAQGAALGTLARLRMKGFGLSIDDYGTGFSSLQRLAQVPWTELKIDRSFVDGAHRHAHRRAILQSAIEMASRLQIASVAEGVETLEDWRLLQRFGCTVGQGWLFGRAMSAAALPAWLKQHALRLPELRAPDDTPASAAPETHP